MKKLILIAVIIFSLNIFSYPFVVPYFNEEFFLYPFLNYDHSVEWKKAREGKLFDGGVVQMSYGSLTTYDLMNNEEVIINKDISDGFTFRFRYRNHETRHLSYSEKSLSTGIGYKINGNFTVLTETELSYEKADIDIKPGVLLTFQTVYAYFGVNFTDFLFDVKNMGGGVNNSTPVTISTDIRFSLSRLYFFISGNYGTGINRTYPKEIYKNHIRNLYARIEYDLTDYLKIYTENYWDDFYDESKKIDTLSFEPEYQFSAKLNEYKLGTLYGIHKNSRIDLGLGYAETDHNSFKKYSVIYSVFLPYAIYDYKFSDKITIQAAYMGSLTLEGKKTSYYDPDKKYPSYWDKQLIKFGAEYRFSPNCSLYISAGQLINTGVFGGGNARFNLTF